MRTITTVAEITTARDAATGTVGLVPTMGFLHDGHLSLVRGARAGCDTVIVSIFVNPAQFGPGEDLDRYPRDEERDLTLLRDEGVDLVFMPPPEEVYPPGFSDWVEVSGPIAERLEGEHRPGHFRGVATVVARLFRIVRPDRAYFGDKDAQQLRIIRRLTRDLGLPVDVVGLPIVREADGLAMSSRNAYLSPDDRARALALSRALRKAERAFASGERDAGVIREAARRTLDAASVGIDYVSVAGEGTLEEIETIDRPALLLLAATVGVTRLIDNTLLVP
ncbi:MAG: pantoate--beta-alanine ligase, partial [Chloroflexi bacterium]